MCLTAPAQVIELRDGSAVVQLGDARLRASAALTPAIRVGDWALVSAGTILEILDPGTAAEIGAALRAVSRPPAVPPEGARR